MSDEMRDGPRPTMTVKAAAEVLDVHPNTIRNWIRSDLIEAWEMPGSGGFKRPYADSVMELVRDFDHVGLRSLLAAKADRMERQVAVLRTMVAELDATLGHTEAGEVTGDGAVRDA